MIQTKGTELYVYDGATVTKVACVSAISEITETMSMRDRSTLCQEDPKEEPARSEWGDVSFTTRLTYDTSLLINIQRNKQEVELLIGFGDGKKQPYTDENGILRYTGSRTWVFLNGYFTSNGVAIEAQSVAQQNISFKINKRMDLQAVNQIPWSNGQPWSNGEYWR